MGLSEKKDNHFIIFMPVISPDIYLVLLLTKSRVALSVLYIIWNLFNGLFLIKLVSRPIFNPATICTNILANFST